MGVEAADEHGPPQVLQRVNGDETGHDNHCPIIKRAGAGHEVERRQRDLQIGRGALFPADCVTQSVRQAARSAGKQKENEVERADQQGRLLSIVKVPCHSDGSQRHDRRRSQDRLQVVLHRVKDALDGHRLRHQTPKPRLAKRVRQCFPEMAHDQAGRCRSFDITIECPRIAQKIQDAKSIGNRRNVEEHLEPAGNEHDRRRDEGRERRAELAPRTRVAIDTRALADPVLHPQPGEDHRLVGAGAKCLAHAKKEHRRE
ncbi:MAG TPA: hypothetical protein VNT79_02935 [Phycisphaerae bacterium]|nr:hypothetical protein [Phycisphaerae bacterium]